ncbi:hypothetical protein [Liquorilactobacillus nagelii]|jgi:hypothetical protein|uniref:hypothetical protein n=1 Tax=Liquorilactobacillus nagelii TaxID=82688 RepID=UPI00242CB80D|nr:hypothetical protein [Liquorilactobacillus nagelii]MCI1700009.1 hypothetical protein [Liquorilactobacillus nagelii]
MIKVPYWFDVWYRNIDTHGLRASKKEVAIKKIANSSWGTFFYEPISLSLEPDVLPVNVDRLKCCDYVVKHRIKLIKAIIEGYEVR